MWLEPCLVCNSPSVSRDDGLHILPPIATHIGRALRVEAAAPGKAASLTGVSEERAPREEFESSH